MRTFTSAILFALSSFAFSQGTGSDADAGVPTIRISANGICYLLNTSTPCNEVGAYLLSKHLAANGHVHIVVDKASKYDLVTATLESLQKAGFGKIGFVNYDASR